MAEIETLLSRESPLSSRVSSRAGESSLPTQEYAPSEDRSSKNEIRSALIFFTIADYEILRMAEVTLLEK